MASIKAKTLRGMAWLTGGTLISAALRLVIMGIYARVLQPSDFGTMAVANIFIDVANVFASSGIVQTLVQRERISDEQIRTVFTANMAGAIAITLAVCAASPLIAAFFHMPGLIPILCVVSLVFPVTAMSTVSSRLLERAHRFDKLARSDLAAYVASSLLIGLPLVFLGAGVWALVVSAIASTLIRGALLLRAQPHRLGLFFRRDLYVDLMKQGSGYLLQRIANFAAMKGDYTVVGSALGPSTLGAYERSYVLMNLSNQLITSNLRSVLFPAFSRIADDPERQGAVFLKCMVYLGLFFLPISAAGIVLAPEVIATLLGPKWGSAVIPFQILMIGMYFRNAYKIAGTVTDSNAHLYRGTLAQLVYAVAVVGGACLLVRFGINGVACSTLIAVLIVFALSGTFACQSTRIGMARLLATMLPGLAAALVIAALCWGLATPLRRAAIGPVGILAVCGLACTLLAGAVLIVRPGLLGPKLEGAVLRLKRFGVRSRPE